MIRTQIQISEGQALALRRLAHGRGASIAQLIREAIDYLLRRESDGVATDSRKKRALAAAGSFRSGLGDLSERHDDYLVPSR